MSSSRELFGGSINVDLPTCFVDVSQFRQVADNTEVFTDADTGACLIVEILSHQMNVPNADVAAHIFKDIAQANGSPLTQTAVLQVEHFTHHPLLQYVEEKGEGGTLQRKCIQLGPEAPAPIRHEQRSSPSTERAQYYASCVTQLQGTQLVSKFQEPLEAANQVFVVLSVIRFGAPISADIAISVTSPSSINPKSSEARVVKRTLPFEAVKQLCDAVTLSFSIKNFGLFA